MKQALRFEFKRKTVHLLGVLYLLLYYFIASKYYHPWGIFALAIVTYVFLAIEFARLELKKEIPIYSKLFRKKEDNRFGGHLYMVLGVMLCLSLFEFAIAFTAVLVAIVGDLTAALIGVEFGKVKVKAVPKKHWEGVIGEFFVGLTIAFLLLGNFVVSFGMALTAALVETRVTWIDDNFIVPIAVGIVGQLLVLAF